MSTTHTKGPWLAFQYNNKVHVGPDFGESGSFTVAEMLHGENQHANAERIVACVNACEGIEDPSVVPELIYWMETWISRINNGLSDADSVEYITNLLAEGKKPLKEKV